MRWLEKIIRQVRHRNDAGKVVLAALVAIWLAAASSLSRVNSMATFEGFDNRFPDYSCGLAIAGSCSSRMLLDPLILARRIEIVPPGAAKLPYRPAQFAFSTLIHGSRGAPSIR